MAISMLHPACQLQDRGRIPNTRLKNASFLFIPSLLFLFPIYYTLRVLRFQVKDCIN